ncbi:MAG TPA: 23S rRNA (guanosine(2251)-2'-O)-methyltransferase RlmB [Desulfocapsa sulfexigens]|nr:23S rRNA (guanosine(2251)-2'-O)-methyltransferase RlmB [Desulfocapsa sulfexigens]HIQ37016.1 23S rRNA (guanosine(2251)-2'-O)-methyltransferase RlmB [Desulfocapsa sulfexigens]
MKKNSNHHQGNERKIRLSEDLLWGIHPIYEALEQEPQRISEVFIVKDRRGGKREEIIEKARAAGIKMNFVSSLRLTGEDAYQVRHQGVVAKMSQTSLMPFDDLLDKFDRLVKTGKNPGLIVLDTLQDPHNIGAIIRSAHASGMDGVLVTRERSAPIGGTAAKSAAGAMSHIDICQVTNLAQSLQALKEVGAWIFGAIKDADAKSLYETDLVLPACIVVGSEGSGIRPLVRKQCDVLLSIPMEGKLDSLNSSVAAGVIMFEILRQRQS